MENLIVKLQEIRSNKSKAILMQKYEEAGKLRNNEKQVYKEIYKIINSDYDLNKKSGKEIDEDINTLVINYLNQKYNTEFTIESLNKENLKSTLRTLKLKKLGI